MVFGAETGREEGGWDLLKSNVNPLIMDG